MKHILKITESQLQSLREDTDQNNDSVTVSGNLGPVKDAVNKIYNETGNASFTYNNNKEQPLQTSQTTEETSESYRILKSDIDEALNSSRRIYRVSDFIRGLR